MGKGCGEKHRTHSRILEGLQAARNPFAHQRSDLARTGARSAVFVAHDHHVRVLSLAAHQHKVHQRRKVLQSEQFRIRTRLARRDAEHLQLSRARGRGRGGGALQVAEEAVDALGPRRGGG